MVEEIIVYRRRLTEVSPSLSTSHNSTNRHARTHHSSLKRKPEKIDSSQEFHTMIIDPTLGVQEQGVKRKLKQKQGIKTHNDQLRFKDEKKIEAYFGLEVDNLLQSELVDVDLTVQASNRVEKVPFVSLTSESYGKPILGYPLEIGELTEGSETQLPSKESVARNIFGDIRSRLHQLVWRTSRRTPVCYVTNSLSSLTSKNVQAAKASENVEENGVLTKENSLMRKLKNSNQFNQGKTASSQTCVPVELIFSKISSSTILSQHI